MDGRMDDVCMCMNVCMYRMYLLPIGSEEREVLGVGSIHVAILPSCQYMHLLHHNCIDMNKVG